MQPSGQVALAVPAGPMTVRRTTRREDARFLGWLAVVTLIHALFVIGFAASEPKRLGSPGGEDNAISVDIVSLPDPNAVAAVAEDAAGRVPPPPSAPPAQPAPPPSPAASAQPEPPAEAPRPVPPTTPPPTAAPAKSETAEALKPTLAPEPAATQVPSLDEPDEAAPKSEPKPSKATEAKPEKQPEAKPQLPAKAEAKQKKPSERPVEAKPPQPAQAQPKPRLPPPQQQVAKLDLSPPTAAPVVTFNAAIGTGTGSIARPAGITRSGLNDEFARKVVAALQKTMPQINTRGTLVVEIRLDMNGNLVTTIVRQPSNIAGLDGSVVFATKQTSFPIPFTTAKPDDLIFFVRYIYR